MTLRTRPLFRLALLVLAMSEATCAKAARQPRPILGTVTIGITTRGDGPNAFTVTVEPGGITASVKADAGVLTRSDVTAGRHTVRLLDLPARCSVEGGAQRTITISETRRSAVLRFDVVCGH
jgi:hypothetical protein